MRNAWWTYISYDAMYSLHTLDRPIEKNYLKHVHFPHPNLDFNPGPFDLADNFSLNIPKPSIPTPYQTLSHFNSLSRFTWVSQCINAIMNAYLDFNNFSNSKIQLSKHLKEFQHGVIKTVEKYFDKYDLRLYEENIASNPEFYATTGHLITTICANNSYIAYYIAEVKYYSILKNRIKAKESRIKAKLAGKKVVEFMKRTFKLPGYPPPVLDLTEYYIASTSLMRPILCLAKVFVPAENDEDLKMHQYLIDFVRQHVFFRPSLKYYVEWCESHLIANGDLKLDKRSKSEQTIMLKLFHEEF
jgi:hypothetical protein